MNPPLEIIKQAAREIEAALIDAVERIEGRVPTNDEIRAHMKAMVMGGVTEYTWKGTLIARAEWWPNPQTPMRLTRIKSEFAE